MRFSLDVINRARPRRALPRRNVVAGNRMPGGAIGGEIYGSAAPGGVRCNPVPFCPVADPACIAAQLHGNENSYVPASYFNVST